MFDCLKRNVEAKIIVQLIEKAKPPKSIEILKNKIDISNDAREIKINFIDSSIYNYKVYDCKTKYESHQEINSISVYYNQINYFYCGDGKHSAEIIFSNFVNKLLKKEECIIEYEGRKYMPIEEFGLKTRKRINFININIEKLKLPKDLDDNEVEIKTKDNKNFLIWISVVNKPKIISIYLNNPYEEEKICHTEEEIIIILNKLLNKVKKNVYLIPNENYFDYYGRRSKKILDEFSNLIIESHEIEKKICSYFHVPREELNENQIKLYELYSEFMIYFSNFGIDFPKEANEIKGERFYHQYYFSQNSINNFYNTIPKEVNKSDRVKLKFAACRCLRTLLNMGYGDNFTELFKFIDFENPKYIYYEANLFNKKFAQSITEKSEIFIYFLQINSGSSINLITNELTARISMLDEKIIKANLLSTIPKYGIKILGGSPFNACTYTEIKITCIHEESCFRRHLKEENLLPKNDFDYNIRYLLANLMQHENFGHINCSLNFFAFYDKNVKRPSIMHKSEQLSPFRYYMIKDHKEEMQEIVKEVKLEYEKKYLKINSKTNEDKEKNDLILKGESGIALSFFLTRGKYKLMKVLRRPGINFSKLYENPSFQAAEDLTPYIEELDNLYKYYHDLFKNDSDDNIEFTTRFQDSEKVNPVPFGIPTLEKFN